MNKILLMSAFLLTASTTVVKDLRASAPSRSDDVAEKTSVILCSDLSVVGATLSWISPSILGEYRRGYPVVIPHTVYSFESAQDLFSQDKQNPRLYDIARMIVELDDAEMLEKIQAFCIDKYGARSKYFDDAIRNHSLEKSLKISEAMMLLDALKRMKSLGI